MDMFEFASKLNGREYRKELTPLEEQRAKELGLIVLYGCSDDLAEFRGAYDEEVDCFDGGRVLDCVEKNGKFIDAVWSKEGYSWVYETNLPHATFDIYEDGEKYCRGIVFKYSDAFGELSLDKLDDTISELYLNNLYKGKLTKRFGDLSDVRPDLVTDGWVTGSLVVTKDGRAFICVHATCSHKTFVNNVTATMFEVIPESVKRYTQCLDMNGKMIFTGDIVKEGCNGLTGVVKWDSNEATYKLFPFGEGYDIKNAQTDWEVIGDVYDNSEFLF